MSDYKKFQIKIDAEVDAFSSAHACAQLAAWFHNASLGFPVDPQVHWTSDPKIQIGEVTIPEAADDRG